MPWPTLDQWVTSASSRFFSEMVFRLCFALLWVPTQQDSIMAWIFLAVAIAQPILGWLLVWRRPSPPQVYPGRFTIFESAVHTGLGFLTFERAPWSAAGIVLVGVLGLLVKKWQQRAELSPRSRSDGSIEP